MQAFSPVARSLNKLSLSLASLQSLGSDEGSEDGGTPKSTGSGMSKSSRLKSSQSVKSLKDAKDKAKEANTTWVVSVLNGRTLVEHFASKLGVAASLLTSHQLVKYLISERIYPPTHPETKHLFVSKFSAPDCIITYTWSTPLMVVMESLLDGLGQDARSHTFWLDIMCVHQFSRNVMRELEAAQVLYASALRHVVAAVAGRSLDIVTRAWCVFELAVRMRGLGFSSPPQLVVPRGAFSSTDPAQGLAYLLRAMPQNAPPSFMHVMVATNPDDIDVIKREIMRVFHTAAAFDELILSFIEADEVTWLAATLPSTSDEADKINMRRQVVAWVMRTYKATLPKVDTAHVVMAILMHLELEQKMPHLIIKRMQDLVQHGASAFDWRHLNIPAGIRSRAKQEVRDAQASGGLMYNSVLHAGVGEASASSPSSRLTTTAAATAGSSATGSALTSSMNTFITVSLGAPARSVMGRLAIQRTSVRDVWNSYCQRSMGSLT